MSDKVDKIIKEVESIILEYQDHENQSDADVYLGWRECAHCLLASIKKINSEKVSDE